MTEANAFSYGWDGSDPDWVVVRDAVGPTEATGDLAKQVFHIYKRRTKLMILIEDEKVLKEVIERMIANSVGVIDAFPPDDFIP